MTERHATNICAPSYSSQIPMKALFQAHYDLAIVFRLQANQAFFGMVSMQLRKSNIKLPKNTKWFYSLNNNEKAYTTKKCTVAKKETKLRAFKSVTKLRLRNTKTKTEAIFK